MNEAQNFIIHSKIVNFKRAVMRIAGLIPQSLQLQAQVTLDNLG
jgi:hypothetical protein